jgi:protein-disulfide isomerase
MQEEKKEEISTEESSKDKKIKNLISLTILLGGLFVGSLFVDVAQLIRGGGFSFGRLTGADVFQSGGKTWVSYSEPIVNVKVINDDSCDACKPDEALLGLKRILPTLLTQKVDQNSAEGQKMIGDLGIKSIPAFVFTKDIEKTDFYKQAAAIFEKKNDQYVLNTAQVGLPVGKYLELPKVTDSDVKVGSVDAKVKMIVFSDFQCPYCKAFHPTIKQALSEYGDKILFVFKQFPLSNIHPQALPAALASECANEQGKFLSYADKLFEKQAEWGKTTGIQSFKTYAAQLGLSASQFGTCLDSKKYQSKVDADQAEGQSFGISGTPDVFVNSQFQTGAVDYPTLKKMIDQELSK